MNPNKPRRSWRPLRSIRRLLVFLAYDLLHALNLVGDGINSTPEPHVSSERSALRRRRRFWRVAALPLVIPLAACWKVLRLLAAGLRVDRLASRSIKAIPGHFHAFLDNWGLIDDAIDGSSGPRRRMRKGARFILRSGVRIIPWLRRGAFYVLSELFYHLGVLQDSVDVRRVWTRQMTMAVLPAVLGVVVAIGVGIRIAWTSPDEITTRYAELAQEAMDEHDHARATLWLTRLVKLHSLQPDYRYELAAALDGQGLHDRAWALMQTLAPAERAGYPHAHFWLARQLCAQSRPTVGDLQTACRHLMHALEFSPDDRQAHGLLARALMTLGDLKAAEKHLKQAAADDPDMQLLLAALHAREGKSQESEAEARQARDELSRQSGKESNDSDGNRLRLVDALVLTGDFAGAERLLAKIDAPDSAAGALRRSQLYLAWYDWLGRNGGDVGRRRSLLTQAIDAAPWSLPGLKRLLDLKKHPSGDAAWASAALEKLDWSKAPAEAHIFIGMNDWEAGNASSAKQHLEAAYRASPHDVRASNNLAWILAHSEPPELERALKLATDALDEVPGQPNVLDTQGRILFKLGRWSEALRVFESLSPTRPQDKQLHEMLAACYGKLGMPELANFQRRLAANTDPPKAGSTPNASQDGP